MKVPIWNDPRVKRGTMIRSALWLASEIGVGGVFTKEQHRNAFKGIAQADRRLRDLRKFGWVICTNLEDVTLHANEQRFVKMGLPVWEAGVRKLSTQTTLTAKQRRSILAAHDFQCAICGIAGGEEYADLPGVNAVLSITRTVNTQLDDSTTSLYTVECKQCRVGARSGASDSRQILEGLRFLSKVERELFISWATLGRRQAIDRLWIEFRRQPNTMQASLLGSF